MRRQGDHCAQMENEIFSVPSPPTLRLWRGQQQRFKQDTQHLSFPISPCLFKVTHRLSLTEAQGDMLSQTHTHAALSFPLPPFCSLGAQCPPHPSLCLLKSSTVPLPLIFWLDFLALLVTFHRRLSRKSDFCAQNISFLFFNPIA